MPKKATKKEPPAKVKRERFSHPAWKAGKIIGLVLALVFSIALAGFATIQDAYAGKAYPGVVLGDTSVAGKTAAQITARLTNYADQLAEKGVSFTYNGKTISLSPVLLPEGGIDFSYEMFSVNAAGSAQQAIAVGRNGSKWQQHIAVIEALFSKKHIPLAYSFDRAYVLGALQKEFKDTVVPAENAEFQMNDAGTLVVIPEKNGSTLSFAGALTILEQDLAQGITPGPFTLQQEVDQATVTAADLESVRSEAEAVLARGDVRLTGPDDMSWTLTKKEIAPLISADENDGLALHVTNATAFLNEVGNAVVVEPKNGKFTRSGNKVEEFQVAEPGRKIDISATQETLSTLLFTDRPMADEGAVTTIEVQPNAPTAKEIQQLGLTDRIGIGHSNFKGSPVNRRYNIGVGAAAVNGTLIAPGEEFSLVKTLGRIDGTTGYRQELVIKGNKTIPEYGGGLCQIGTTVFRAALAAGLPITARTSHSYAVTYYNDENGLPGTDATIYDPSPDFKFLNDTGNYILIQTRIEGDDLYFDFWGTQDGRKAEQTKPVVSNRVAPPPTRYVETTDLAPGVEKCTERAHAGMDAQFTYTVTYANGEVKEQVFTSHYRPWQAVCLRGIDPAAAAAAAATKPAQ